jgi:D-glycero-alpha-D-manno-heptose 1-phosphate guanylyltransferase
MITEAIILAGGMGTRLQSVLGDLPKSLAPVAGKPFLSYLLDNSKKQGIKKFIFALGHGTDQVESFVKKSLPQGSYVCSVEEEPLGTGGAIYKACGLAESPNVIVLNADTFFGVSYSNLTIIHELRKADCTLALKPMKAFDRYGAVEFEKQVVIGFKEKKYYKEGFINGGVYALSVPSFLKKSFPVRFSFEQEYLEKEYRHGKILALVSEGYFIDIGIPEDYQRAQEQLVANIQPPPTAKPGLSNPNTHVI